MKHIAGKFELNKLFIGDEIYSRKNEQLTGKNKAVCINHGLAKYTDSGNSVKITKEFLGEEYKMFLSKEDLETMLKNF